MRQPAQLVKKEFLTSWWTGEQALPPLPSSIRNGRSASCAKRTSGPHLLIGLTTACFRHRRRPSCAPLPVSAKILRISGRGNCKEAIFALENGIFLRKNRPVPAVHAAGDDCTAKGLLLSRALLLDSSIVGVFKVFLLQNLEPKGKWKRLTTRRKERRFLL